MAKPGHLTAPAREPTSISLVASFLQSLALQATRVFTAGVATVAGAVTVGDVVAAGFAAGLGGAGAAGCGSARHPPCRHPGSRRWSGRQPELFSSPSSLFPAKFGRWPIDSTIQCPRSNKFLVPVVLLVGNFVER